MSKLTYKYHLFIFKFYVFVLIRNIVKLFFTAGLLMDVLSVFGDVSEEIANTQKYAKWKATYIHNCMKNGETPIPGPPVSESGQIGFNFPNQGEDIPQPTNNFIPVSPTTHTYKGYLIFKLTLTMLNCNHS